jgi:hypothetical protein
LRRNWPGNRAGAVPVAGSSPSRRDPRRRPRLAPRGDRSRRADGGTRTRQLGDTQRDRHRSSPIRPSRTGRAQARRPIAE